MDSGSQRGLQTGQRDAVEGDTHPPLSLRLPYLFKAEEKPESGFAGISLYRFSGFRLRHRSPMPLRGYQAAYIYGFCVPFAQDIMRLSEEAKLPVKIRLCDTMGYRVPYQGASLPRSVPKIIRAMIDDAGVPSENLEWHGHNDFYKGFINATTAWLYGCSAANGTLLGFGERTGNPPIEGLIFEYINNLVGFC